MAVVTDKVDSQTELAVTLASGPNDSYKVEDKLDNQTEPAVTPVTVKGLETSYLSEDVEYCDDM